MRMPSIRFRNLLGVSVVALCLVYLFLVLNVTIVLVQDEALLPSVASNSFVFLEHEETTKPGDVVAIGQSDTLELRRVFALGPVTAQCVKGTGFIDGEMVRFSTSHSNWSNAEDVGEVSERWGLVSIPIRRNMKLVSQRARRGTFSTVVPDGAFLVGCQNRVRCGGCGFRSVTQAEVFGQMRQHGLIFSWLSRAGALWRSL
jgi:hypothetical protein